MGTQTQKDWTGGNNSVFTTIGAKGHSDEEREANDFYATSPKAIDKLASVFTLPKNIYECACGQGHLSERLKELGCNVYSSDLIDRGYGETGVDFLQAKLPKMFEGTPVSILTNPPYKISTDFIIHALDLVPEGSYVIFFLKTTALEGKSRYQRIYKNYPPPIRFSVHRENAMCQERRLYRNVKSGKRSKLRMVCMAERV